MNIPARVFLKGFVVINHEAIGDLDDNDDFDNVIGPKVLENLLKVYFMFEVNKISLENACILPGLKWVVFSEINFLHLEYLFYESYMSSENPFIAIKWRKLPLKV